MLAHRGITSSSRLAINCIRCFVSSTQVQNVTQPSDVDEWNNWEFGSFHTRKRKTTEQAKVEKNSSCKNKQTSKSHNIDNEWSYLSDYEVENGIMALKAASTETRIEKLESVLEKRTSNIRFVFEDPNNPNNLWAALRTADSFGIQHVDIIVNEGHSPALMQSKMVQALGSQKWLTLTQHSSTAACLETLKSQGYSVFASDLGHSSKPIGDLQWRQICSGKNERSKNNEKGCINNENTEHEVKKVAVVMGSEKTGISPAMRCQADALFYLPMKGFAESFNLAAATAITCAYLDAMQALKPSLCPHLKRRILLTWLARSVDGSMPLLRKAGLDVGTFRRPPYAIICGASARP